MEVDALEQVTDRLRTLLRLKVPDLLLQAECGGGLELPTPLPWGFANVPALYRLADYAERDLQELRDAKRRARSPPPGQQHAADERDPDQEPQRPGAEPQGHDQEGPEPGRGGSEGPAQDRPSLADHGPEPPGTSLASDEGASGAGSQGRASEPRNGTEPDAVAAAEAAGAAERPADDCSGRDEEDVGDDAGGPGRVPEAEPAPTTAPRPFACGAFLESLELSRTYRSPHCEAAMAEAMGMMELYDGLSGSTLGPPPSRPDLEALRTLFKEHINARWALEAVKQGVGAAKQGNYADAHKAYARALELDPASVEAYVARGAAHANQRAFADAERDLRHALTLDPAHRNAAAYLEAVLRKVEEQQQQLEALEEERQMVLARQTQQQHARDKRRQTGVIGGTTEGRGGRAWMAHSPGAAMAAAPGRPAGQDGMQGPPSAPGRLQRGGGGGDTGLQPDAAGRRRRRASDSSGTEEGSDDSSGSGDSSGGTPGRTASLQPGSDDIRRALEVVLKARKQKKKSKHKSKQKKKHKKSKKRRRD